jgi:hypothetical protein
MLYFQSKTNKMDKQSEKMLLYETTIKKAINYVLMASVHIFYFNSVI